MKKEIIVISLGGSLIVPEIVNPKFLEKFKKTLRNLYKTHKFVVVCGGGTIARKYIAILKEDHQSNKSLSIAGIRATRENARFMMQFFGRDANDYLPKNMKEVKSHLKKNSTVFCGALRYSRKATSDATAVKLAHFLKTYFINITDVDGLYTKNPIKFKDAKLISKISWREFEKMALKSKYAPGQHFVLDQNAATLIRKYKIQTYIMGKDLFNLEKILKGRSFEGTLIKN